MYHNVNSYVFHSLIMTFSLLFKRMNFNPLPLPNKKNGRNVITVIETSVFFINLINKPTLITFIFGVFKIGWLALSVQLS